MMGRAGRRAKRCQWHVDTVSIWTMLGAAVRCCEMVRDGERWRWREMIDRCCEMLDRWDIRGHAGAHGGTRGHAGTHWDTLRHSTLRHTATCPDNLPIGPIYCLPTGTSTACPPAHLLPVPRHISCVPTAGRRSSPADHDAVHPPRRLWAAPPRSGIQGQRPDQAAHTFQRRLSLAAWRQASPVPLGRRARMLKMSPCCANSSPIFDLDPCHCLTPIRRRLESSDSFFDPAK